MLYKNDFTILCVDDEEEVLNVDASLLKLKGYNVLKALNGKDAIEIVKNNNVDVVVLDYFMPEMTGEEVVREIRKFNKEVVILLQTAYSGKKPPMEMLENLEIQGYHDKSQGMDNLLLWITSCTRVSALIKDNKKLFEEVTLANKTIESIKKEQDKLIEQQKLAFVGKLTWNITEKLNMPMWGIRGLYDSLDSLSKEYSESIDNPEVTKDDHKEIAKEIKEHVDKSKEYIDELEKIVNILKSQLTRLEDAQDISVRELVDKSRTILIKELKFNNCDLKEDVQDSYAIIKNGDVLVPVFNNIIYNSIQAYGETGGEIEVKTETVDNNIRISVIDYGKGISKDIQEKIFKEVATDKKNNLGMGLYICNAVVKGFFGGKMWFESEEGKGTKVCILIPYINK